MDGRSIVNDAHMIPPPRLGTGICHPPQPPTVIRFPTTRTEAFRTSSKLGSRHPRQANYTTLRQIGGCPAQPRISCDSPSAGQAGPAAPPRRTGLPSLVTIGRPLIIFNWAKREFTGHSKAKKPIRKSPVRRRQSEGSGGRGWIWSGHARAPGWRVKVRSRRLYMSDHGSQVKKRCVGIEHTVFTPEYEPVQSVETEKVEEIPRERRDPSHIHVGGLDPSLQHRFEPQGEGERELDYTEQIRLVNRVRDSDIRRRKPLRRLVYTASRNKRKEAEASHVWGDIF